MALATNKSLFLHIPKTAGMWIRHAYKVSKIEHREIGEQHSHFPEISEHNLTHLTAIVFVRHPLSWYRSRWAFRMKHGWKSQHPLDFNCASNNFEIFVDNVLRYKPDGWFSWECRSFIDTIPPEMKTFIGKTENLVEDTISGLTIAGENFNQDIIKKIPRINDSHLDGQPPKCWAKYSTELAKRVITVESDVIRRYYNNDMSIDAYC